LLDGRSLLLQVWVHQATAESDAPEWMSGIAATDAYVDHDDAVLVFTREDVRHGGETRHGHVAAVQVMHPEQ
jgi:hypothetical protein